MNSTLIDFFSSMPSVHQDTLIDILNGLSTNGADVLIRDIEESLASVKRVIDSVNGKRQLVTNNCDAVDAILKILEEQQKEGTLSVDLALLFSFLRSYRDDLRVCIEESKPVELLRQKFELRTLRDRMKQRTGISESLLIGLKNAGS